MLGDASNGWPMEDIFFYNNFGTTSLILDLGVAFFGESLFFDSITVNLGFGSCFFF